MLPVLPTDEEFANATHFPHDEGQEFEFKQSVSKVCLLKMEETLCGFLNGKGGYFVCGVNDKTRKLCWMNLTEKDRDRVRLRVDQIFHGKIIHDDKEEGLDHKNLVLRFVNKSPNETLVIISVVPTEGRTYRLFDTTWYRLNASNYRVREEKLYKLSSVNQMISQSTELIRGDYEVLVLKQKEKISELEKRQAELDETYRNMSRCMMVVQDELRSVKKESEESLGLLEKKILMEKVFIEEVLEKGRSGVCSWLGFW